MMDKNAGKRAVESWEKPLSQPRPVPKPAPKKKGNKKAQPSKSGD